MPSFNRQSHLLKHGNTAGVNPPFTNLGPHHHVYMQQQEQQEQPCLITSYTCHKGGVTCVKFRPLMKHLVSGGADGSVLMWSLFCRPHLARQTQIRPYRFVGHQAEVCALAISPLDTVVASASKDKTVRLWIPTSEGKGSVIRAHSGSVRSVAFSPNGELLLTGSDDKSLKIWDVDSERFLTGLSGHMNWVRSAEFNLNGRLVVSGGDDKTVRIWDVESHECLHTFSDVPGMVHSTRFHPNGYCVGSCGVDQAVQIWDIRSKMLIQHYAGKSGAVKSLSFHPSGNYLLSTCDDCTLKIWDLREGQILYTIKGHEGATTCAEFSPTGDHFASGSVDEQVMLWQSNLKQLRKGMKTAFPSLDLDNMVKKSELSTSPVSSRKTTNRGSSTPHDPDGSTVHKGKQNIKKKSKETATESSSAEPLPKQKVKKKPSLKEKLSVASPSEPSTSRTYDRFSVASPSEPPTSRTHEDNPQHKALKKMPSSKENYINTSVSSPSLARHEANPATEPRENKSPAISPEIRNEENEVEQTVVNREKSPVETPRVVDEENPVGPSHKETSPAISSQISPEENSSGISANVHLDEPQASPHTPIIVAPFVESRTDVFDFPLEEPHIIGAALKHLVKQMDMLTRTVSTFSDRLSRVEDKVSYLGKRGSKNKTEAVESSS